MTNVEKNKERLCEICSLAYQKNMVVGTGGNISFRDGDYMYITPTGLSLEGLSPNDLVRVSLIDESYEGNVKPSSETKMHICAYLARPDAQSVVHLHSFYSILVGITAPEGDPDILPAYTVSFANKVGRVEIINSLDTKNSETLEEVGERLQKSSVILLKHHGVLAVGENLNKAFFHCEDTETNSKMHMQMKGAYALPSSMLAPFEH